MSQRTSKVFWFLFIVTLVVLAVFPTALLGPRNAAGPASAGHGLDAGQASSISFVSLADALAGGSTQAY